MEEYEKAKKLAAGYVAARMYTCREIEERLIRKKISAETAERVVSEFASAGILDDREYAKAYVYQAIKLEYKGAYRIRQELYLKGVARSITDDVLENTEDDIIASLKEYVSLHGFADRVETRRDLEKLKAKLARRGYSPSEIKNCLWEYEFNFKEEY